MVEEAKKQDITKEELAEEQPAKKSFLKYIIIIAVLGLFSAVFYSIFFNYINEIPEIQVPDVVGLDKADAIMILEQHKLEPYPGGSRFSEEATINIILETEPEAGRTVKIGRKVKYIVNIGQEQITIPEIKGLTLRQARGLLKEHSLIVNETESEYSSEYREGTITATSPNAGEYVDTSTTINVILSKGFPVDIILEKIEEGYDKILTNITLTVPFSSVTKKTNVKIVSISKEKPSILFNDDIPSGKEVLFEFEEKLGNRIEIFYNDILAKTKLIVF